MAGIVTGIAVTVLYQNVTGMQAGGVMPSREAPAEATIPLVARAPEAPASTPIRLVTVPGLPVLPTPTTTPVRSSEPDLPIAVTGIKSRNQADEEKPSDKDDGTGVHVEIRSKAIPLVAPPAKAEPTTTPGVERTTPAKEAIKDRPSSLPAVEPDKKADEASVIREQSDGVFVRVGNQVRFVPNGVGQQPK